MRRMCRWIPVSGLAAFSLLWAAPSTGQLLTVERAVELALERSTQVINAEAGVWDARGGLQGARAGVLPRITASVERQGFWQDNRTGSQVFGGQVFPIDRSDYVQYLTQPQLSGTWSILDLSSWTGLSSARNSLKAAKLSKNAARNDIALEARQQFYEVVRAVWLARVAAEAARLARDDERRVGALFEVGSVSKSDVLKAQVRTAQSELDSLTSYHLITFQRITLANLLGMPEAQLGEVDTVLAVVPREFDTAALMSEAEKSRPDLQSAELEFRASKSGLTSAQFLRLPYVTLRGTTTYRPTSNFKLTTLDSAGVPSAVPDELVGERENDIDYTASVVLNWDVLDWFATGSRISSARARMIRAREARDALRRNLRSEVDRALLVYRAATERDRVASRAIESATESVKLIQQKYNVGSATILELIDAQVQLQRAWSDRVTALAAIRVAEAQIDRVRGLAQ